MGVVELPHNLRDFANRRDITTLRDLASYMLGSEIREIARQVGVEPTVDDLLPRIRDLSQRAAYSREVL